LSAGRPGPGLLAHVLVSKYADHLPLYRQSQIFARDGIVLERSTQTDWVGRSTAPLEPLAAAIGRYLQIELGTAPATPASASAFYFVYCYPKRYPRAIFPEFWQQQRFKLSS